VGVGECDRPIVPLRGLRLESGWGIWGDRAIEYNNSGRSHG